ncbi:hypothetical protein CAOG_000087 [Capsaspora owczarzaki ATCC 30864]|uniref:Actin maturation protease n=2 Tax=Capsaspora owczarzaki (strain ATCC 30864) TaxID=595528 RepID=A0A0D2WHW5_CAPO3|nr:hypothetical protein CAOG_000087 [Capsaspora owczarzaki ATCC 30864]
MTTTPGTKGSTAGHPPRHVEWQPHASEFDSETRRLVVRAASDWQAEHHQLEQQPQQQWSYLNRNVPSRVQHGPMCGMVALGMGTSYLTSSASTSAHDKAPDSPSLLLAAADPARPPQVDADSWRILTLAKQHKYSAYGEMFYAEWLAELASMQHGSVQAKVLTPLTLSAILQELVAGNLVLFPYDADRNHTPCLRSGHKAHWAILTGFAGVQVSPTAASPDQTSHDVKDEPICADELLKGCTIRVLDNQLHFVSSNADSAQLVMEAESVHFFLRQGKSRHQALYPAAAMLKSNWNMVEPDPDRASFANGLASADVASYVVPANLETLRDRVVVLRAVARSES